MHSLQRTGGALAVTIVLLLGVAACGSDSSTSEASPSSANQNTQTSGTSTAADQQDDAGATSTVPASDAPDPGAASSSYCAKIKKHADDFNVEKAPSEIDWDKVKDAWADLQASAPPELKSAIRDSVDAFEKLSKIDPSDPESAQKIYGSMDEQKLEADSKKIEDYTKQVCHIDLDS